MARQSDMGQSVAAGDWQSVLQTVANGISSQRGQGDVATYIPALARVNPSRFAMSLATCDGNSAGVEDHDVPFSIQSISKVFTLMLALEEAGDALWKRVRREPSGSPFNSIVQLEAERGIPRNPFINAGALVVTDVLVAHLGVSGALECIEQTARKLSGNPDVGFDDEVAASEAATGHRNSSLAHFMKSFGALHGRVDDVLKVYFHQCALAMSTTDLARASLWLANDGIQPNTGHRVVSSERARRINALMLTCGHYDAAGDFAFRVGLPGKSGVGGGIIVVVPDRMALAVWSPGLNSNGNSLVGTLALESFVDRTGLAIL